MFPMNVFEHIQNIASQANFIEAGNDAGVYEYSGTGGKPYAIRIIAGSLTDLELLDLNLLSTTFLTPVDYGYNGRLLAPPLLRGEGISFHPRQPGNSLGLLFKKYKAQDSEFSARKKIESMLEGLELSEYQRLLEDMNFLTSIGRSIEHKGDNLVLSTTTLRWIDIGRNPRESHAGNVIKMLVSDNNGGFGRLSSTLSDKIVEAAKITATPLDEFAVRRRLAAPPGGAFRQPSIIDTIPKVSFAGNVDDLNRALELTACHLGY